METEGVLKIQRITNPLYLGNIAPTISKFVEKVKPVGVTYETLYTYLANSIQYGGDKSEFWVAFNEGEPVAFAHWFIMPLPHTGKVCCDYIMSWNRKREPIEHLLDKFLEFGVKNRSPLYEGYLANEPIFRVFRKAMHKKGVMVEKTEIINAIGRK
jgi:hypothetical protein